LTRDAIAIARRLGNPATLAYVLGCAHWGAWVPGSAAERLPLAEEVLHFGRAAGNRELEFGGASCAFGDLIELGETERADEMLAVEVTIADELRQPDYLWTVHVHRCMRALMDGRYDEAARLADEALRYGQAAQSSTALQMYGIWQLDHARTLGGLEEIEPVLLAMVEQYPLIPAWRSALVYLYEMLERADDVRTHLEILAANDFAEIPRGANWTVGMAVLTVPCAFVGDVQRSARLYELLSPYAEYNVIVGGHPAALTIGSAELFLAISAAGAGRWERADAHFGRAMERNARTGCRAWIVHGKYEYAKLLTRRGDPSDAGRLRDLLRDCVADGGEMGMTRIVDHARSLAGAVGVTLE
jgi:tetratricopeptide (TPR) repeat protein